MKFLLRMGFGVVTPDYLLGEDGDRRTVWEYVPVMLDGNVLDRISIKEN
jgi:hypothetical protein